MKTIYLVGFRGTGFRNAAYRDEPLLIRAGHVGFYFEGDEDFILGFHPTEEACASIGDDEAVKNWLKDNQPLEGALHDDTSVFRRAYALSENGAPTTVYQLAIEMDEDAFEAIQAQAFRWYNQHRLFSYAFPKRGDEKPTVHDNCATFPRQLKLPLPEDSDQLAKYMDVMQTNGKKWELE